MQQQKVDTQHSTYAVDEQHSQHAEQQVETRHTPLADHVEKRQTEQTDSHKQKQQVDTGQTLAVDEKQQTGVKKSQNLMKNRLKLIPGGIEEGV